ncbi:hypothetical protein D3C87_792720 [compost metagenome]
MKLIPQWREWHRFWSVRLQILGTAILALALETPHALLTVWSMVPADLRAELPEGTGKWIGIAVIAFGIIARIIYQPKIAKRDGADGP